MIGTKIKEKDIQHPCLFATPAYSIYVEDNTIGWMLHIYVRRWSVGIYKELLGVMAMIVQSAPRNEVYCFSDNSKLSKFATMFGMEHVDDVIGKDGKPIGELRCLTL